MQCTKFREEFSWRCLALRFHKTKPFCEAQWRWPGLVFVLFRLLMATYAIFAFTHMAVNVSDSDSVHHFMAYLTNWTYLVEMLFFIWGAMLAVCFFFWPCRFQDRESNNDDAVPRDVESQSCKIGVDNPLFAGHETDGKNRIYGTSAAPATRQNRSSKLKITTESQDTGADAGQDVATAATSSLPWYVQVYWILSNIIQVMALVVTIIYFSALYSPSQGVSLVDLNVHGVSSIMIVIDVVIAARPVRLLHLLYPILYGLVYVIFSVIYWSRDHENNVLYPDVLDWNHPGPTCGVVLGLAIVGIPLLQLGHYGIYQLRLWCHQRLYGQSYL